MDTTTSAAATKRAFIIVDIQNDFCEGGSLAVSGASEIIPLINQLRSRCHWDLIVLTADWHPRDHASFGSNHPEGTALFSVVKLPDGVDQVMWPDHCVQNTFGAEFHADLLRDQERDVIVRKGEHTAVDSYSAFFDNNRKHKTQLDDILRQYGITEVYLCGLALDYCVQYSARDAADLGYTVYVIEDASRSISESSTREAKDLMDKAGVKLITSDDVI